MNIIDPEKLENKKYDSSGFVCACPACRHEGRDTKGNHLKVYSTGAFGCVVDDSKEHNRLILQLAGTESDGTLVDTYIKNEQPKIKIPPEWPIETLNRLVKNYNYFEGRGVSAETQKFFKMGVGVRDKMNGRITIPIFNERFDKIIGCSGRLIDDKNSWHIQNKTEKWKHLNPSELFLWPYYPNEIKKAGNKIILVEGPSDVLYLWDRGIKNVICLFGVNISSKVLGYLIQLNPEEILIATNNELNSSNKGVGNFAAEKIKRKLLNFFNEEKVKIALPQLKDFLDFWTKGEVEEKRLLNEWANENLRNNP